MDKLKAKDIAFEEERVWDKKKILFFLIFLILLAVGGFEAKKYLLSGHFSVSPPVSNKSVEGASTTAQSVQNQAPTQLQEKMGQIQKEASSLNVADVASSSPQVQQILNQLKGLSSLPQNEVKQVCERICSGF